MEANVPSPTDAEKHEHPHEFHIFVDAVRYVVTQTSMTGAQIKALANKDAQYQLYLEEEGDHPDKLIGDSESVAIKNNLHFYAIPPATFGQR
jgi:hypothetical protein